MTASKQIVCLLRLCTKVLRQLNASTDWTILFAMKMAFYVTMRIAQEPPKAEQLRFNAAPSSTHLPRVALCILQLPDGTTVVEAMVAVSDIPPVVLSWEKVSYRQLQPVLSCSCKEFRSPCIWMADMLHEHTLVYFTLANSVQKLDFRLVSTCGLACKNDVWQAHSMAKSILKGPA